MVDNNNNNNDDQLQQFPLLDTPVANIAQYPIEETFAAENLPGNNTIGGTRTPIVRASLVSPDPNSLTYDRPGGALLTDGPTGMRVHHSPYYIDSITVHFNYAPRPLTICLYVRVCVSTIYRMMAVNYYSITAILIHCVSYTTRPMTVISPGAIVVDTRPTLAVSSEAQRNTTQSINAGSSKRVRGPLLETHHPDGIMQGLTRETQDIIIPGKHNVNVCRLVWVCGCSCIICCIATCGSCCGPILV